MDKKVITGLAISVLVVPTLIFGRDRISYLWAAPEKISTIEKKVDKSEEIQKQLSELVIKESARQDKQEAVSNAQIDALKAQLELIAQLKKK